MAVQTKKSRADMQRELELDQSAKISKAQVVRGVATRPIAFRASAPLLAALDRLAATQRRSRGNLIQYALWEYVRKQPKQK